MRGRFLVAAFAAVLSFVAQPASASSILFGATGSGGAPSNLYTIDTATGVGTLIGPVGFSITGLAFDPTTGILYGGTSNVTAESQLITINTATGAGTLVGPYGTGSQTMADITFDAAGNLYGLLEPGSDDLYRINKSTGAATLVGDPGLGTAVTGLAFNAAGTLYLESNGSLYILNPATGAVVSTVGTVFRAIGMGMDFSDAGVLFAIERLLGGSTGPRNLVTVNTATGGVTTVGATVPGLDSLAFSPSAATPVPEPASMLLVGTGVALASRFRRRKN
jgi:hypothetical protein